jgi:hypothetical protein
MKKSGVPTIAACVLVLAGCSTNHHASNSEPKGAPGVSRETLSTSAAESLLNHMIGKWVLQGQMAGKETTHDIDAEWVLNHEYVRLHEVSRDRNAKGEPAYEAIVLLSWDPRPGVYSCLWLDSTGGGGLFADIVGHGKPSGDSIPILFKFTSGNRFHTTFIYDGNTDTWQWAMDDEEGGQLQPFARVRLTKIKS